MHGSPGIGCMCSEASERFAIDRVCFTNTQNVHPSNSQNLKLYTPDYSCCLSSNVYHRRLLQQRSVYALCNVELTVHKHLCFCLRFEGKFYILGPSFKLCRLDWGWNAAGSTDGAIQQRVRGAGASSLYSSHSLPSPLFSPR